MRTHRVFRLLFSLAALFLMARGASAQASELRGTVRDSASGLPVAGTVVLALDGTGNTVAQTLANTRGQYRLSVPTGAVLLRAIRMGYRAATARIPSGADTQTIDLVISTAPQQLLAVNVTGARGCPIRSDRAEASMLLEQTRAALLATVIARESRPGRLVVLRYERELDLDGIAIQTQRVRVDSSFNATTSFNAARNVIDFVHKGFRVDSAGMQTYFGPDADVLLDERFQRGYCFTIAARDSARPTQVGLHFSPADSRKGRVDIDGTFWIDTVAHSLREVEYRYKGIESLAESFDAGGRMSFVTLPNGVPFIDRWNMRLVGASTDRQDRVQGYTIFETGGELERATWVDNDSWNGAQGSLTLLAVAENGQPAKFATLSLAGTDYRATADSSGRVTFRNILPGPYAVSVDADALNPINLSLPTGQSFVVARNSVTIARVQTTTVAKFFSKRCGTSLPNMRNAWVIGRVFDSDGNPLTGVPWRASVDEGFRTRVVSDKQLTDADGLIVACHDIPRDSRLELTVPGNDRNGVRVRHAVDDLFSVVRVVVPSSPGAHLRDFR